MEKNKSLNNEGAQETKSAKSLNVKKIGIFAAIGVIVVGVIIALIFLLGGDNKPAENPPHTHSFVEGKCECGESDPDYKPDDDNDDDNGDDSIGDSGEEDVDPDRNLFIDSIGGVSETFKGTVSENTYNTANEAASAFVSEEIAGESVATVHSVKSNGELSQSKIDSLNIPAELLVGSDSVEEMEVTYDLATVSTYARSGGSTYASTKTIKVYVIKYGVDWKYFTPAPITGDTITKSYYDSVFNTEKYTNCTFENNAEITIAISADGEYMDMKMITKQIVKHADGKVYFEQTISSSGILAEMEDNITICVYLETIGDEVICYVKNPDGDEWIKCDLGMIGFTSLDELVPFHDQYLDYTYFTKTSYGFALNQENSRRYFMQALGANLEDMGLDLSTDNAQLDMFAEYYVADGVLSGMRLDADFEWSIFEDGISGTIKETAVTTLKCTDYGTTVIERPNVD